MKALEFVLDCSWIAAYFVMSDFVAPSLVGSGYRWLWCLIIIAWVGSGWMLPLVVNDKERSAGRVGLGSIAIAFLLLLGAVFLYDEFAIQPYLKAHGLGLAWIPALILLFAWILACVTRIHQQA